MDRSGDETKTALGKRRAPILALLAGGVCALCGGGALGHDEQAVGMGISQPRLVAMTGLLLGAPGGTNESIRGFSAPAMSGGVLAVRGETSLARPGVFSISAVAPEGLRVVALSGQQAAGGGVLSDLLIPSVSPQGRIVFGAAVNGQLEATRVMAAQAGVLALELVATGGSVLSVHAGSVFETFVVGPTGADAPAALRRNSAGVNGAVVTRGDAMLDELPLDEIAGASSSDGGVTAVRSRTMAGGGGGGGGGAIERLVMVSAEGGLANLATFGDEIPDAPGGMGSHHDDDGGGGGGPAERLFAGFLIPSISRSGRAVAFVAADGDSEAGVYLAARDSDGDPEHNVMMLSALADESLHVPGTHHHFLGFGDFVSVDDGPADSQAGPLVALVGFGSGGEQQVLVWQANVLATAAFVGQVVDGRTIATLHLGSEALNDGRLAFAADFTDGSSGLLVVTVPGPGGAMVMALAGARLGRRGSRGRKRALRERRLTLPEVLENPSAARVVLPDEFKVV